MPTGTFPCVFIFLPQLLPQQQPNSDELVFGANALFPEIRDNHVFAIFT
jgi:hypothetical protein